MSKITEVLTHHSSNQAMLKKLLGLSGFCNDLWHSDRHAAFILQDSATAPCSWAMPETPMQSYQAPASESEPRTRILKSALKLFARQGYDGTTTKDLAEAAGVAEGTLFRHFSNKKAILIEVATQGWIDILTDLLTELSGMGSYKAVAQVMRRRMLHLHENADMLKVCFMEAQFHPDLRDRIQTEVIEKMTDVAEAFFQTAMDQGVYRPMNPKMVARVFLGMFAVAGFSQSTVMSPGAAAAEMQELAEALSEIFLNGVLVKSGD